MRKFINGKMIKSSTLTYTWTLIPVKAGQLTIPAFKIKVGKKSLTSSPITITVSKRGTRQSGVKPQFFIEAEVTNSFIIFYFLFYPEFLQQLNFLECYL